MDITLGYIFSMACAILWSLSLVMFKSIPELPAIRVNLVKNLLSLACLLPTFWIAEGRLMPTVDATQMGPLIVSGLIGIGIADALVLAALRQMPAGFVSLLECTYAPFVLLLSLAFLDERLDQNQLLGVTLVLTASLVASFRGWMHTSTRKVVYGIGIMVIAIFLIAVSIIIVKPIYQVAGFWDIVVIRMIAGCMGSAILFGFFREPIPLRRLLGHWQQRALFWTACFFASYLGLVTWLAGYKYISASLASVLNQTSTIFTLILAAVFLKERLNRRGYFAVVLASIGIVLISLGKAAK